MPEKTRHYTIPIAFDVTGSSREEAASALHNLLTGWVTATRDMPVGRPDGTVVQPVPSWWFPEAALKHIDGNTHTDFVLREPDVLADMFEGSPIPELLAEMFPSEPQVGNYIGVDGRRDDEGFEQAHQQWRDQCLSIAVQAAHLADITQRLRRAESVRDGLIDLVERVPLPQEPRRDDYLVTADAAYEGEFDTAHFGWDHRQWQADFTAASNQREREITSLRAGGGARTPFLPVRFQKEWVPADLLAIQVLRALVAQEDGGGPPRRILDRDQRAGLRAMLFAADPDVHIPDPTNPDRPALYRGLASEAALWVPPGVYEATGDNSHGAFRVVVGPAVGANGQLASAAFPVGDHDSAAMNKISHILQANRGNPNSVLAGIDGVVAGTGRDGRNLQPGHAGSAVEHGVFLADLLRQRERELGTPDTSGPGDSGATVRHDPIS